MLNTYKHLTMIKFKRNEELEYNNFESKGNNSANLKIVGLIMVKNQEKKVLETISSISKICESIIVVDTGSKDNTINNIKKAFPSVALHYVKWEENYGKMRNKCLSFVPNNSWIFFVDSDESLLSDLNKNELCLFLNKMDKLYPDQDKICTVKQMQPDRPIFIRSERFIKKTNTLFYYGYVHEEPRTKLPEKLVRINTNIEIINNGTTKEEINKFSKVDRYAKLLIKNIKNEPNNPRWISLIAPTYISSGYIKRKNYINLLRKSILKNVNKKLSDNNVNYSPYLSYLLERYCVELINSNELELADKYVSFSKRVFPYDANFIFLETSIFFKKVEEASKIKLKEIISFTSNKDHELIDNESEGTEEVLSGAVVRLLIQMELYTKAKEFYLSVEDPLVKLMLEAEGDLFKQ